MPRPKGKITSCPHRGREFYARGMCGSCYRKWIYNNSERSRENILKSNKKWQKNNPEINKKKIDKKWRKNNPEVYQRSILKSGLKRLGRREAMKIVRELWGA
jgi:hypothetical protein